VPKLEKEEKVKEIVSLLQSANLAILTKFQGLNVAEANKLRRNLVKQGIEYKVVKNTLTRLAVKSIELEELCQYLIGPTAIVVERGDKNYAPRILSSYIKEHKSLEFKAGVLEGRVINVEDLKKLATLPPREVLISQALAGMQAPIRGLVGVLSAPVRNLLLVLEAIKRQKSRSSQAVVK